MQFHYCPANFLKCYDNWRISRVLRRPMPGIDSILRVGLGLDVLTAIRQKGLAHAHRSHGLRAVPRPDPPTRVRFELPVQGYNRHVPQLKLGNMSEVC
jgi:hypothetical protein